MSWTTPSSISVHDVIHYVITIDGMPQIPVTSTNGSLFSKSYPVCNCTLHNVSVSIKNRCGLLGHPSDDIRVNRERLHHDCGFNPDSNAGGENCKINVLASHVIILYLVL